MLFSEWWVNNEQDETVTFSPHSVQRSYLQALQCQNPAASSSSNPSGSPQFSPSQRILKKITQMKVIQTWYPWKFSSLYTERNPFNFSMTCPHQSICWKKKEKTQQVLFFSWVLKFILVSSPFFVSAYWRLESDNYLLDIPHTCHNCPQFQQRPHETTLHTTVRKKFCPK